MKDCWETEVCKLTWKFPENNGDSVISGKIYVSGLIFQVISRPATDRCQTGEGVQLWSKQPKNVGVYRFQLLTIDLMHMMSYQ